MTTVLYDEIQPIFFTSNAIYPADIMPRWSQTVSEVNPLTYQVDALRARMLTGGVSIRARYRLLGTGGHHGWACC